MGDDNFFLLFETATGFCLFQRLFGDEIGEQTPEYQDSLADASKFKKLFKLKVFTPFPSAEVALDSINSVSEGVVNEFLQAFLTSNLPKASNKVSVAVSSQDLGSAISELGYRSFTSTQVQEFLRGIRGHLTSFIKALKPGDLEKAQLGLSHSYSRSKVKFNVNRVDNMIIQSINLLDQTDKDLNTFAMRCKEWYSWHFPELTKVAKDNVEFARLARIIQSKENLSEEDLPKLTEITEDDERSQQVLDAARASMGQSVSELDLLNIMKFADRVIALADYRARLHGYLVEKMHNVAPNLTALVGEQVGARLISGAGSLTNLAKMPASTVQILGAEKALFRALKARTNTPKYGLIFQSSFIGKAAAKNKGRISRYLANKCSFASRIDAFSDKATSKFGERLKTQVEERLAFFDSGVTPPKNLDVMKEVVDELTSDGFYEKEKSAKKRHAAAEEIQKSSKKAKKSKKEESESEEEEEKPKKSKKAKKSKKEESESEEEEEKPKKDKKKAKKSKKEESDSEEEEEEKPKKSKKSKK